MFGRIPLQAYTELKAKNFTFIDLFAGIGGFHVALKTLGGKCIMACEIDKYARKTYLSNHPLPESKFFLDINDIKSQDIPEHDILCAGFPCQPFSQAGLRGGFSDSRGTLFFNILAILETKRTKAFFLENVRHLKKHNNGQTFLKMKEEIENLGYNFLDFTVKASDHGLPQLRTRLFMIGFRSKGQLETPKTRELQITLSDILGGNCERSMGYTLRVGGRKSPLLSRHNWDGYIVDGKEIRLTVEQAAAMQGFPGDFNFPVTEKEAMKQLGNSVAIPAVQDYAAKILEVLINKGDLC